MKTLSDDSRAILAELALSSDPEPATEEDEREARAAWEDAIDAAVNTAIVWEGRDG
jgi:hypothetical protein